MNLNEDSFETIIEKPLEQVISDEKPPLQKTLSSFAIDCLLTLRSGSNDLSRVEVNSLASLCYDTREYLLTHYSNTLKSQPALVSRDYDSYAYKSNSNIQNSKFQKRNFESYSSDIVEPAVAFHIGCKVQVLKDGREGVVVCEKAGGWREVLLTDDSTARFRPSELRRLSSLYSGTSNDYSYRNNYSRPKSTSYMGNVNYSNITKKPRINMSVITGGNMFHKQSPISIAGRGFSSVSSTTSDSDGRSGSPTYLTFATASPLKNGSKVQIVRDGREGIVVCEKLGGWRVIQFPDQTTARFRPSELRLLTLSENS